MEPFKNLFNKQVIGLMADHLHRADQSFDKKQFLKLATHKLPDLELKERSNQICAALEETLPSNYRHACKQLRAALHTDKNASLQDLDIDEAGIRGWAVMPMAEYVARNGIKDFDFSMGVLKDFTKRFTSEFAVRPFLIADPERALQHVNKWAVDKDYKVRRLASEGSRPRLPWGEHLPMFIQNPAPLLPVLEQLKDDPDEYVRRSVANSLNDIAKDHPKVVSDTAHEWMKEADGNRVRLIKHACRTLVKQGYKPALKALGYTAPKVQLDLLRVETPEVVLGGHLEFVVELTSTAKRTQPIIVDFVIHHRKANGDTTAKVFKLKTFELAAGKQIRLVKKHPFKQISTRRYYAGEHGVEIQVNGESVGRGEFVLVV